MSDNKIIRVGVLGACGNIGGTHTENLANYVNGAVLSRIYDINEERTRETAEKYGAAAAASAEDLIHADDVDAVIIARWDGTHAGLAIKCIEAGKPVFCEKPLATTLEDAEKVAAAEKAAGKRLLQIGFMRRFDPDYIKMKEILDSGKLGAPLMIHCISRTREHPKGHTTQQNITNIAIHEIDICRCSCRVSKIHVNAGRLFRTSTMHADYQRFALGDFDLALRKTALHLELLRREIARRF